jgi:demethylmenaquinone methyltransferase/2-methoxy-6-polyprenyl-1,4-benzoquinol methylase
VPLLDHFSLIAPYYDRVFQRPGADPLLAHVGAEKSHRLLDVGGGTGRVAAHFCGLVAQVCIVDPSPKMLKEGQRKGICITQGESERLPFASETFERIIVVDAFHHLLDHGTAACELLRVLAPMGRLVIEEPDVLQRGVQWVALAEKLLLMRSRFFSPEAIQSIFAGRGVDTRVVREGYTAWVIVEKL